jgi:hypothetical protein
MVRVLRVARNSACVLAPRPTPPCRIVSSPPLRRCVNGWPAATKTPHAGVQTAARAQNMSQPNRCRDPDDPAIRANPETGSALMK